MWLRRQSESALFIYPGQRPAGGRKTGPPQTRPPSLSFPPPHTAAVSSCHSRSSPFNKLCQFYPTWGVTFQKRHYRLSSSHRGVPGCNAVPWYTSPGTPLSAAPVGWGGVRPGRTPRGRRPAHADSTSNAGGPGRVVSRTVVLDEAQVLPPAASTRHAAARGPLGGLASHLHWLIGALGPSSSHLGGCLLPWAVSQGVGRLSLNSGALV